MQAQTQLMKDMQSFWIFWPQPSWIPWNTQLFFNTEVKSVFFGEKKKKSLQIYLSYTPPLQ